MKTEKTELIADMATDVAELVNQAFEMREKFHELSGRYFWGSEGLAERLAGQIIYQNELAFELIYKQLNELDHHFKR